MTDIWGNSPFCLKSRCPALTEHRKAAGEPFVATARQLVKEIRLPLHPAIAARRIPLAAVWGLVTFAKASVGRTTGRSPQVGRLVPYLVSAAARLRVFPLRASPYPKLTFTSSCPPMSSLGPTGGRAIARLTGATPPGYAAETRRREISSAILPTIAITPFRHACIHLSTETRMVPNCTASGAL